VADLLSIYPLTVWVVLLTTGIVVGLLAGLLGVGGGIIAVPVLLEVFAAFGMPDDVVVPLAVGTAQTSILIAALVAAFAHWRAGTIERRLVKEWLPALVVGTALGLGLGPFAPAKLLTALFAVIAAGLGIKMALGDRMVLTRATAQRTCRAASAGLGRRTGSSPGRRRRHLEHAGPVAVFLPHPARRRCRRVVQPNHCPAGDLGVPGDGLADARAAGRRSR
jgi:uncharacterized membrane protein YfcA